jgi:hypothetical protein
VCYVGTRDGRTISLREYLKEQGHECEHEVPHPPIFYQGEFVSDAEARGTWRINARRIALGDGRAVRTLGCQGNWTLRGVVGVV